MADARRARCAHAGPRRVDAPRARDAPLRRIRAVRQAHQGARRDRAEVARAALRGRARTRSWPTSARCSSWSWPPSACGGTSESTWRSNPQLADCEHLLCSSRIGTAPTTPSSGRLRPRSARSTRTSKPRLARSFWWTLHVRAARKKLGLTTACGVDIVNDLPEDVAAQLRAAIESEIATPLRERTHEPRDCEPLRCM